MENQERGKRGERKTRKEGGFKATLHVHLLRSALGQQGPTSPTCWLAAAPAQPRSPTVRVVGRRQQHQE